MCHVCVNFYFMNFWNKIFMLLFELKRKVSKVVVRSFLRIIKQKLQFMNKVKINL